MQLAIAIGKRGVSIVPDQGHTGFAHLLKGFTGCPEFTVTGSTRLKIENRAIVLLAGEAAQRKHRPSSIRSHHGSSDRRHVIDLLTYVTGSDRELRAYVAWLSIRSEQLVALPAHWAMIVAVAHALLGRDSLSSSEVIRIARIASQAACALSVY